MMYMCRFCCFYNLIISCIFVAIFNIIFNSSTK